MTEYINGIRVRVLPMGVSGVPIDKWSKATWDSYSTWGKCPEGYETTEQAAKRLRTNRWAIRKLCVAGKLEHIRRGYGKRTRLFIKQGAKPTNR